MALEMLYCNSAVNDCVYAYLRTYLKGKFGCTMYNVLRQHGLN